MAIPGYLTAGPVAAAGGHPAMPMGRNRAIETADEGRATVTDVRIFQPTKTAMQSGMRNTRQWIVAFEPGAPRITDPLMGWIGSTDTRAQVRLRFDSAEEAIAFAERNRLSYRLIEPQARVVRPKSYAENFRT